MTDIKTHRYPKGRRPTFNDDPAIDELMSMVMVLSSEISVLRDRLDTFEKVADQKDLIGPDDIENYEPDEATLHAREAGRQEFLERLYFVAIKRAKEIGEKDDEGRYLRALDDIAMPNE